MTQKKTKIIEVHGVECATAREAIQNARAEAGVAIRIGDKILAVTQQEADRLAAAGIAFAYLCDRQGQIMAVPVND
jgi:hypothetical protein